MKTNIKLTLKKNWNWTKKHTTNLLLGIIIIILLVGLYNLSDRFREFVIITSFKGARYKSEIVGKAKYSCQKGDVAQTLHDESVAKLKEIKESGVKADHMTIDLLEDLATDEVFHDEIKYFDVIRSRVWKFGIFKVRDFYIYPKADYNCRCTKYDIKIKECEWTKLDKPINIDYRFK